MRTSANTARKPDFLRKHFILTSFVLLVALMIIGHFLWVIGVIPDNNTGGEILYSILPIIWLLITAILAIRKFMFRS